MMLSELCFNLVMTYRMNEEKKVNVLENEE